MVLSQAQKTISYYKIQSLLFVICIFFAIGTYMSVDSIGSSVENYVEQDSLALFGGDILVESNSPFSSPLQKRLDELSSQATISYSKSFASIIIDKNSNLSTLCFVRVVDSFYPLYGEVLIEDQIAQFPPKESSIFVSSDFLVSLNTSVGSQVYLGNASFTIAGVLTQVPDSQLDLFTIGPRVFISNDAETSIGFSSQKSRVSYDGFIKTQSDTQTQEIYTSLTSLPLDKDEEIELSSEENSSLERFTTNFLFFIKLISIFLLFITGIGIHSTISSLLRDTQTQNAIYKFLGETKQKTFRRNFTLILLLALTGFFFSVLFSLVLLSIFPFVFSEILPEEISFSLGIIALVKGAVLSLLTAALFTYLPLYSLLQQKPLTLLKKEEYSPISSKTTLLYYFSLTVFFIGLLLLEIQDVSLSLALLGGFMLVILFFYLLAKASLYLIKRLSSRKLPLIVKLSLKGLFRNGAKSVMIILTLSLSLTLMFSLSFLEENIQNQFVTTFPKDSPNMFIIDIQKEDREELQEYFSEELLFYPVIRGSILKVNEKGIEEVKASLDDRGDRVDRVFTLTYATEILPGEELLTSVEQGALFSSTWEKEAYQVSVYQDIAQRMNLNLGDELLFTIQGIEIKAEVVSFRDKVVEDISPYFYFTFKEEDLSSAPQTLFTTYRIENQSQFNLLQNQLAQQFPQITIINAQETAKSVGEILEKLSGTISFFTLFSLLGALLILISSIYATNLERTKEAVYIKLVGGNSSLISKIFFIEYLLIGVLSASLALGISYLISFVISYFIFEISFTILLAKGFMYLGGTIVLVLLIGQISIRKVMKKKPLEFIREENVE